MRIHLNSRVVEHERHELAVSFAIEVPKLLELDDLSKPAFQKRLIVDDGRSLLESAFQIGFAAGLFGACRDEPGKLRQAIQRIKGIIAKRGVTPRFGVKSSRDA